jgi:hypothetical protein
MSGPTQPGAAAAPHDRPGGSSQGAIPGAIGGSYRATQGDPPRQPVQLNGLKSDASRRTVTLRRCLLSSGSRVRILPGARILQADLTPAGRTVLRACRLAADAVEEQMLAPLAPGDIEQFTATLRACIQALSQDR